MQHISAAVATTRPIHPMVSGGGSAVSAEQLTQAPCETEGGAGGLLIEPSPRGGLDGAASKQLSPLQLRLLRVSKLMDKWLAAKYI